MNYYMLDTDIKATCDNKTENTHTHTQNTLGTQMFFTTIKITEFNKFFRFFDYHILQYNQTTTSLL